MMKIEKKKTIQPDPKKKNTFDQTKKKTEVAPKKVTNFQKISHFFTVYDAVI